MRILLVEDEKELARSISRELARSGFVADCVSTLGEARRALKEVLYSLVVLDRRLPDGDGITLTPEIRRMRPGAQVLVLTACGRTEEIVAGLDAGADDYLTKPFDFDELLARIRVGLRRHRGEDALPAIVVGDVSFDPKIRDVAVRGKSVILHGRELMLLEALLRHAERMVSRQALLDEIYGPDEDVQPSALNILVMRLRRRLEELDAGVKIHAARGVGYMIAAARA
ncbi:Transcriptional+regulatory+protein+BasR [Methylocapsa aurea]|jgi:two-component system OmpR family response regulator|uniref:response regulator transcription factor n=1 Tax=Methylocapsa aurea TaxID=663610 RepID=UPI003D18ED69